MSLILFKKYKRLSDNPISFWYRILIDIKLILNDTVPYCQSCDGKNNLIMKTIANRRIAFRIVYSNMWVDLDLISTIVDHYYIAVYFLSSLNFVLSNTSVTLDTYHFDMSSVTLPGISFSLPAFDFCSLALKHTFVVELGSTYNKLKQYTIQIDCIILVDDIMIT